MPNEEVTEEDLTFLSNFLKEDVIVMLNTKIRSHAMMEEFDPITDIVRIKSRILEIANKLNFKYGLLF